MEPPIRFCGYYPKDDEGAILAWCGVPDERIVRSGKKTSLGRVALACLCILDLEHISDSRGPPVARPDWSRLRPCTAGICGFQILISLMRTRTAALAAVAKEVRRMTMVLVWKHWPVFKGQTVRTLRRTRFSDY